MRVANAAVTQISREYGQQRLDVPAGSIPAEQRVDSHMMATIPSSE